MTIPALLRRNIYIITFLYQLSLSLLAYFHSTFLFERGYTNQHIGLIFVGSYIFALILILCIPYVVSKVGDRAAFSIGLVITGLSFIGIALTTTPSPILFLIPFAVGISSSSLVLIDIFLATVSGDVHKTAGRRGLFISLVHLAIITAQLLAMYLLIRGGFEELYLLSGIAICLIAILSYFLLSKFRDAVYEIPDWRLITKRLLQNKDLVYTFIIQFLLRGFYAMMVIFTPLYLLEYIGIPVEHMGYVFAFMLLPFVVLEIPIGKLEDEKWGEQEVLITGFILVALTTATISFITSSSLWVWALALFATRVGAALVDIGSEAYFFKHVHGSDSGEVSAYRALGPLAFIAAPLLTVLLLFVVPLQYVFLVVAALMLLGVIPALRIQDSR